jgi:hypothetical protein
MRTRLVLLILSLFAGACSDVMAPTIHAPQAPLHTEAPGPDGTCRSGYSVATGRNGETICVPDGEGATHAIPRALPDSL